MKKTASDQKLSVLFTLLCVVSIIDHINGVHQQQTGTIMVSYLDPGTGTMIISAIIGILATIGLGVKTFWYKIVTIFKPGASKKDSKSAK